MKYLLMVSLLIFFGQHLYAYDWTLKNASSYTISLEIFDGEQKSFMTVNPGQMSPTKATQTCTPRIEVNYIDGKGALHPVWDEKEVRKKKGICAFAGKLISLRPVNNTIPQGRWISF